MGWNQQLRPPGRISLAGIKQQGGLGPMWILSGGSSTLSFSEHYKNVLLCLLRIFRDASVPLGYFQYFRSHKVLADKAAHVVTTLGWRIICLPLLCLGEVGIWWKFCHLHLQDSWVWEAPILAFKCSSHYKQQGHTAATFSLFPFSDGRQGEGQPTKHRLSHNYLYFNITTCLGTGHPRPQVNRWQAGGPWPGVSFPSIAEQQTQVKCDPEPEHEEMFWYWWILSWTWGTVTAGCL